MNSKKINLDELQKLHINGEDIWREHGVDRKGRKIHRHIIKRADETGKEVYIRDDYWTVTKEKK